MREQRREREERSQQQRSLLTEQLQATAKESRQLQRTDAASSTRSAAQVRQDMALRAKLHDASVASVNAPISGVGKVDTTGLDMGAEHNADIPVQVWISDTGATSFDPLVRWESTVESTDRSVDPMWNPARFSHF